MDLHQLRTFLIVAEEGNLTRAAKRLFTTPPSVSSHIKALEEEWGVVLFTRTSRGMSITPKGSVLLAKARGVLDAALDLSNHATQLQGHLLGDIRMGLNASATWLKAPEIITVLRDYSPGVNVEFVSGSTHFVVEGILKGTMDCGFVFGSASSTDLHLTKLGKAKLAIAVPKSWAKELPADDWSSIARRPWIVSPGYCPFQVLTDQLFLQRQLEYARSVNSDDEYTKIQLVENEIGIALVEHSEALAAQEKGLVTIWNVDPPVYCQLSFGYLLRRQEDPLIKLIRSVVVDAWHDTEKVNLTS